MKFFLLFSIFLFSAFLSNAQQEAAAKKIFKAKPTEITNRMVEVSCGQCQFKMKGKSCDLAVKINGKAYFVDGSAIDDFGDAHAKDGFCQKIRKAKVSGKIIDNRFKATSFKL